MAKRGSYVPGGPYTPTRGKFAGRTFATYEAYRRKNAKAAGKSSPRALALANAKKRAKDVPLVSDDRSAAMRAIATSRRNGISLAAAAKRENTTVGQIRAFFPNAVRKASGKYVPTASDRSAAAMYVQTPAGTEYAVIIGDKARRLVAEHYRTVYDVARGRGGNLAKFRGKRVAIDGGGSLELLSDPAEVRSLLKRGLLTLEGPYVTGEMAAAA